MTGQDEESTGNNQLAESDLKHGGFQRKTGQNLGFNFIIEIFLNFRGGLST